MSPSVRESVRGPWDGPRNCVYAVTRTTRICVYAVTSTLVTVYTQEKLSIRKVCYGEISRMESIEKVLYEAAVCPGVRIEVTEGVKPWQSEDI